jgi:UDP-N-acetyl-D-mannosaminuronic acid dehydrogenase
LNRARSTAASRWKMTLLELKQKIDDYNARIAVIGLGFVGLPVACEFARAGYEVLGVERDARRVRMINQGISPIEGKEPGLGELLAEVIRSGKLHATAEYLASGDEAIGECDIVLVDVETPVEFDSQNGTYVPQYSALRSALLSLGAVVRAGTLVIIESTIAPGTMRGLVEPLLKAASGLVLGQQLYLANCPERVMPGKLLANLRTVSRVVGGMTPEIAEAAVGLYRQIVSADLDPVDCVTAELVKTVENAYRDVQIAFANETALICEATGGDVWKVRELVNKSPFRQMHLPGAGVGGHCIPKDPWLLAYGAEVNALQPGPPLRLIPAARQVNDSMPAHMANLTMDGLAEAGVAIERASILVMGYAYLEDSDDARNSPSASLVENLLAHGARAVVHDPYINAYQGNLLDLASECDAAVVMVRHQAYRELDMGALKAALRCPVLIDGRRVYDGEALAAAGWIYRVVGRAAENTSSG